MKNYLFSIICLCTCLFFSCQNDESKVPEEIIMDNEFFIWETSIPGSDELPASQVIIERDGGESCPRNRSIKGVTKSSITPFFPDNPNGVAVVICPGGGYGGLAFDKEGTHLAQWYNQMGITAFVLKYRLPYLDHGDSKNVPLQDAQRAMRLVKSKANEWNIDPEKVGIMGSSAGGHLAATLGVDFDKSVYNGTDEIDKLSARPAFMVLLYPVISMDTANTHLGSQKNLLGENPSEKLMEEFSAQKHVKPNSPVTFIAHAKDDQVVTVQNSILFDGALKEQKINSALYLYANGGHGGAICMAGGTDFAQWIFDCRNWLNVLGLVN